jgi:hypothetical protein
MRRGVPLRSVRFGVVVPVRSFPMAVITPDYSRALQTIRDTRRMAYVLRVHDW